MDESVVQQKSQGTIGYRWLGSKTFAIEPLQHIVGTDGAMTFQQNTQRASPYCGKSQLVETAVGIRLPECPSDTPFVIVSRKPNDGLRVFLLHV